MDYVTLMGAEQVANAGYAIRQAAENMSSAAGNMDHTLSMFLRNFEELVYRFEAAAKMMAEGKEEAK